MKSEEKIDVVNCQPDSVVNEKANANLHHLDIDPFYAHQIKNRTSRARKLLKKRSSLRSAFLLREIFSRPYDF